MTTPSLDFNTSQPSGSASFANPLAPTPIQQGLTSAGNFYQKTIDPALHNLIGANGVDFSKGQIAPGAYASGPNQNTSAAPNYSPAPNYSFGNPSSPDLSNPVKQTDYNNYLQSQQGSGTTDPYASIRNDISSAWDNYLNGLGGVQNDLNTQKTAQQGIADTQLQSGQNTINAQKAQSLKDIANTTRSAFQAGNNYLGSLGAGDSSAANQYAFAINQQAGKQTGDLNNFVNSQLNNLQSTHDTQINSINNWFAQQQEALKQQIAQGQLNKGQDVANLSKSILDQAIAATQAVKQNTQNQYNALVQWAANNSSNIGQLQQNIAHIPGVMGNINLQGGTMTQPTFAPSGVPTSLSNQKTDIFGNPIQ